MTQCTDQAPKDQRRTNYLVGRDTSQLNKQIGGCPWANTLTAWSEYHGWHIVIAIPCKRWGCHHCGRIRSARLARATDDAKPNRFITLTTDAKLWPDGRAAFDGVRRKLPDFSKAVRKKVGTFEYVRVLELHRNGMPHWHLVVRSPYIPQPTIKEIWATLTGSTIVDVRAVKQQKGMARYVMKYLSKCHHVPWTNRRVSWSKNFFPKYSPPDREPWNLQQKQFHREDPAQIIQQEWFGWRMVRIGPYAWTFQTQEQQSTTKK